jgi:hypothetical protein
MNESDKKRLTEWLGECWHIKGDKVSEQVYVCSNCARYFNRKSANRTFTEDADFFACFEKLVEKGEWEKFGWFAVQTWQKEDRVDGVSHTEHGYNQWLLSRTESGRYRLCVLVAEWRAQKEGVEWPKSH